MKDIKLAVSISVDGKQSTVSLELVPVEGDKFQPVIDLKLSNGVESTTKLAPSEYINLRRKIQNLVNSTDPEALASAVRKLMTLLSF